MLKHRWRLACRVWIACFLASGAVWAQPGEGVRQVGEISYVSGGVGDESLARISALEMGFNVKLVLALNNGEYLSDVEIRVVDADGRLRLQAVSEGPMFLLALPAGTYEVSARYGEVSRTQRFQAVRDKLRVLHYRWPATE